MKKIILALGLVLGLTSCGSQAPVRDGRTDLEIFCDEEQANKDWEDLCLPEGDRSSGDLKVKDKYEFLKRLPTY